MYTTNRLKKHHFESTLELAKSFQIDEAQCHIEEGLPEDVIPDVAANPIATARLLAL